MARVKLLFFALDAASRAGLHRAGAEAAGGEFRRRRALAYTRLYEAAMDEFLGRTRP